MIHNSRFITPRVIASAEIVALIAAAVAVFAAVLAVRATALVARTVVANRQGEPGADPVSVRVTDGHTRRDVATDARDYAFVVALSNQSGLERRFTPPFLRVTYRTRANFLGAVDLASSDAIAVPAAQTTNATIRFTTSNTIPRHCRIDAYTLIFTDDKGGRITVDASLPAVIQADTDGTGPRTWGFD
jgi:hypothetical protein